ncbi:hypothetical protein Misp05_44870 [Micromonospora sp. NBRC 107095]|nr:hypothetical protein Misp05_44870 [Micromonospora sp. NBRC 107095]
MHEILSGLTKQAAIVRLTKGAKAFPFDEFEKIIAARSARFAFRPAASRGYLDAASQAVWQNALEFYSELTVEEVAMVWDIAAGQHEEARGRKYDVRVLEELSKGGTTLTR